MISNMETLLKKAKENSFKIGYEAGIKAEQERVKNKSKKNEYTR